MFELAHQPGTIYAYSNFGYSLLGRIIESVSGRKYEDYIRENVLRPVGAEGMMLGRSRWEDRDPREVVYREPMRRSRFSRFDGTSLVPWQYGGFNLENFDSHGGWIATAEQLVRVAGAFTDPSHSPLLNPSSIATMWAAGAVNRGYGKGWVRLEECGVTIRSHDGSIPGTWACLVCRDDGICFAILLNQRSADTISPYTNKDGQIRRELDDAISRIVVAGGSDYTANRP